jgi:hypothetical protein
MKRRFTLVMGLAALVLAVVLTVGTLAVTPNMASAQASLQGSWGFSAHGVRLEGNQQIPVVEVGLFSFDGNGGCSHSFTGNSGGENFAGTAESCTYTVNPNGTGTITFNFVGEERTYAFVLVAEASEFHFLEQGPAVLSGAADRQ